MHGRIRRCAPVLLLALTGGCFNYRPASVAELEPGMTVRAYLSQEQAAELNALIGHRDRQVVGKVVGADPDRLLIEIRGATVNDGLSGRQLNQRIAVPRSGLMEVEERSLNGWKTALVTGGITAAVAGLVALQLASDDNSPLRDPKDPPDAFRFPLIRISIPPLDSP